MEYAVIETGGKQYTVKPGDTLQVEKLVSESDEIFEIDRVLLYSKEGELKIGQPLLDDVKVKAQVIEHGKLPKVTVFKYKPKVRYMRKIGHRQHYTMLRITEIIDGDQPEPKRRRSTRSRKADSDGS